jgi:hypothetical protein
MVLDRDLGKDLSGRCFRIGHIDGPVTSMIKYAGIHQLELGVVPRTPPVLIDQPLIGKRLLRVVISPTRPGVAGHPVEIPPILLDVLAVVSLRSGEAEHALFQDRVNTVPKSQGQTKIMVNVRKTGHAVFVPSVGSGSRVIMWKEAPGVAVVAVVLPYGAPGALREIWAPLIPRVRFGEAVLRASRGLSESRMLGSGT